MRGLNAPPRRRNRAGVADGVGDIDHLRFGFDRAGPGDDADGGAADGRVDLSAKGNDGAFFLDFARGHFVGSENGDNTIDAGRGFEDGAIFEPVVANDCDDGSFFADDDVIFEFHFSHQLNDMVDLFLSRPGFHDNDHLCDLRKKSPGIAKRQQKSPRTFVLRPSISNSIISGETQDAVWVWG